MLFSVIMNVKPQFEKDCETLTVESHSLELEIKRIFKRSDRERSALIKAFSVI